MENPPAEIIPASDTFVYPLQWVEKVHRLIELRPFEHNPRTITEKQFERLKQSIVEDGYHSRIKATHDLRVVGGHQRLRALRELGFHEVPVLVPDRPIDDATFRRILIRDNHNNGTFDIDLLSAMFDAEELKEFGLPLGAMFSGDDKPPRSMVCCPKCGEKFPVKGNKA